MRTATSLAGMLVPALLWAQQAAPPTIVANAQEVALDLIVRDKHGRPVADLKPSDLQISDNGTPVKLAALRLVTGSTVSAASDPLRAVRLVTLVFDRMGPDAARLARETAREMIKSGAPEKLWFGVLRIDQRLRLVQEFTTDAALALKAVDAVTARNTRRGVKADAEAPAAMLKTLASDPLQEQRIRSGDLTEVRPENQAMARMMVDMLQTSEQMSREEQSRPSLGGLLAVVRRQGELPGRKTVVYFSEGLPVTTATRQTLQNIIGIANRANVSIYAVDASGLTVETRTAAARDLLASAAQASINARGGTNELTPNTMGPGPGTPSPSGVTRAQARSFDTLEDSMNANSQAAMMELARSTGGFYLGDSNDLRKPARRVIEEVSSYYEASYVPESDKYDGSFRRIEVKALRPGLKIQARSGYFALPPEAGAGVQPFEARLLEALHAAAPPRDLLYRAGVLRYGATPAGVVESLTLELPLENVEFHEDATSKVFNAHLSVLALVQRADGQVVRRFSQDIPYRGPLEAAERARRGVFSFQRHFVLEPGQYTLRTVIADRNANKTGAQEIPLRVPAAAPGAAVSELALVRRLDPLVSDADAQDPLVYQNSRVIPNLEGAVSRDQGGTLSTFFVIYPDPGSAARPQLEMEVLREGEPLGHAPLPLPETAKPGPIPYVASLPLASLRPGRYELRAEITQGAQSASATMAIRVDGKETPGEASAPGEAAGAPAVSGDSEPIGPSAAPRRARLAIAKLKEPVTHPGPEDEQRILAGARQRAMDYVRVLPNFTCIQITRRLADSSGREQWREKDTITEVLRYLAGQEWRATLEINGQRSHRGRNTLHGTFSSGEFGALLAVIFDPASQAQFEWKEMAAAANQPVHVFAYRVPRAHSQYVLRADELHQAVVGFHGLVYIDAATRGIRRVTMEAEDIPSKFPFRASSLEVDYDEVAIGDHDYLLPIEAEVRVRRGKRYQLRNELEFRDYRRFGAQSNVRFAGMD